MKGFTLVELLVATALLGTIAAAGLGGLLQAATVAKHVAAEQTLQERAEYALATLEGDIQMSGYFGFGAPASDAAGQASLPSLRCGNELLHSTLRAVELQPAYALSCPAAGSGSEPGSPVFILRRVSTRVAAPEAGRVQWYSSLLQPEDNQFISDGRLAPALLPALHRGELRNLVVRAFYIARGSDGDALTPSLRVKSLSAIAGHPAFIDTEVMPGIVSMHIEPLPDLAHPTSLRIVLGLRSDAPGTSRNPAPLYLFTRHFALRNVPRI